MLAVIIASLMSFAQPSVSASYIDGNNVNQDISSSITITTLVNTQSNAQEPIYGYHVSTNWTVDSGMPYYLTINTSSGSIPLKFEWQITQNSAQSYWYELYISYNSNDTYRSNLYLNNFYAIDDADGYSHRLPNIYFTGESDVMNSREGATLGFNYQYSSELFSYEFDLMIFPSSLIVPSDTYQAGYDEGYEWGKADGLEEGRSEESQAEYDRGYDDGRDRGYQEGISDAHSYNFPSLFASIADTPILIVRSMFDFDFFGVNMLSVVLSLFTAFILFYLLRKLF